MPGLGLLQKEATGDWYRLIGIGVGSLHDAKDADPIDLADPDSDRRRRVEAAMDSVRAKLGKDAIVKGRSLKTAEISASAAFRSSSGVNSSMTAWTFRSPRAKVRLPTTPLL